MKNQLFVLFTIAVLFSAVPQVFSESVITESNNSTVQSPTNSSVTPVDEPEKPVENKNVTQSAPEVNHVQEKSVVAEPVAATSENKTEQAPIASTQNQTTEATPKKEDAAAPVKDSEKQTTKDDTKTVATPEATRVATPLMTILGRVLFGFATLSFVIFIGCIYNYRYQIRKYKVAPFTPPSFCPSCLFPKVSSGSGSSGYGSIEIGDYNPPRYLEF